jgi:hypothetical protein
MALFGKRVRSARLREARKRRLKRNLALSASLLVSIIILSSQVTRVPAFLIQEIDVRGNEAITKNEIVALVNSSLAGTYFFLSPRNNQFLLPKNKIALGIANQFKRVDDIQFQNSGDNTLVVKIHEREPIGVWCKTQESTDCYFIDYSGFVFSQSPQFSGDVFYTYRGGINGKPLGQTFVSSEAFVRVNDFIEKLRALGVETESYEIIDTDSHQVFIKDGGRIIFSTDVPYEVILENIRAILASDAFGDDVHGVLLEVDYIDLRFGNKVFYKFNE